MIGRRGPVPGQALVEELFRDHGPAILGYLARRTDPATDAADLMSEVMLTAWRRRTSIPPPPDATPWLYGVARNVLSNHRRSERRRTAATQVLAGELTGRLEEVGELSPAALDIRAALRGLDEVDREIVTLSAWEGLTSGEIAVVTGLPASTVRARLARSRARLRTALSADSSA